MIEINTQERFSIMGMYGKRQESVSEDIYRNFNIVGTSDFGALGKVDGQR